MNNIDLLKNAFYTQLDPPPDLNIWQWADKYRILSSEASSEPGPWRTDRFPFTREIMEVCSPQSPYRKVGILKASQVAGTEIMLNFMGYNIHYNPGPMLYIQKTVQAVERFVAQRFTKSLEKTPEVKEKLPTNKSRDDSNTKSLKNFPGGLIVFGGANSAASLRSMPIRDLLADELDSFESDIEEEGDPMELAEVRTSNFSQKKIIYNSTPKITETSKIEPIFKDGDQRYFKVPCPHCGTPQVIYWANIKYVDKNPKTARLQCIGCNKLIEEKYKTMMLANGFWEAKHPGRAMATFFINAFYSPLGFKSWADIVEKWLKYRQTRDEEKLRVITNTAFGESYSQAGKVVYVSGLESRKEDYANKKEPDIPNDVLVLTCGVDVQDNRIEAEIVGWGEGQESWSIDYVRFMGDPEFADVWVSLDDYLKKKWRRKDGYYLRPACTAIDSGYKARKVYMFCKTRLNRRIFAIKGVDGWGKGLINRPSNPNKDGVYLFLAYVDELKSKIYSQLNVETIGPGFCHFPQKAAYDTAYFAMLTSEKLINKRTGNKYRLTWTLKAGQRNEALDARNYAITALNILNPNFEQIKKRGIPLNTTAKKVLKKRKMLSKGLNG